MILSKRLRNRNGFSLIEVMVATVILSGAILVLANAWSGNFGRVRNARLNNTMAMLLERKMTEFQILAKEKPLGEIKEEDGGDFGAKFPGYRWEMKSQSFEMPNMAGAMSARKEGVDELTLTIVNSLSQYIKDAVKEMSVTIFFKARNGREIKQSATLYLIDYAKELPIPGLPGGMGAPGAAPGAAPGGTPPAGGAK